MCVCVCLCVCVCMCMCVCVVCVCVCAYVFIVLMVSDVLINLIFSENLKCPMDRRELALECVLQVTPLGGLSAPVPHPPPHHLQLCNLYIGHSNHDVELISHVLISLIIFISR